MGNRFDELLRRCKKRRRKLWARRIGVAAVIFLLLSAGIIYSTRPEPFETLRPTAPVSVAPSTSTRQTTPHRSGTSVEKGGEKERKRDEPKVETSEESVQLSTAGRLEKRELVRLKKEATPVQKRLPKREVVQKTLPKPVEKRRVSRKRPTDSSSAVHPPVPRQDRTESPKSESAASKPLIEVKEATDLNALIRQFKAYPRYTTALKVAKIFYEKGDFEQASYWARKANVLDRDDEEAWILYAKSEYALDREERAKRILKVYLDYRNSARARALLMRWSQK